MKLVNLLIVQNAASLHNAIASLDILPSDVNVIKDARATQLRIRYPNNMKITLEDVMEKFVDARKAQSCGSGEATESGLLNLLEMLKKHREELRGIAKRAQGFIIYILTIVSLQFCNF